MAYVDTSALLKWYVPETGSDHFSDWIASQQHIEISRLTCVEVRCALARRQRAGSLSEDQAQQALDQFLADVHDGLFTLHTVGDAAFLNAESLLASADQQAPLRTLDALHLAVALDHSCSAFITADRGLAEAAILTGLQTLVIA